MQTKIALALTLALTGLTVGCGHRPEERRAPREHRAEFHGEWHKLGERWVDGTHDRDVIWVGGREGGYRRIMIVVENSALEMFSMRVVFGDGESFSPPTRLVFGRDSTSRIIDLPGDARVIRRVEFRYGNLPGGGRARVELWAK